METEYTNGYVVIIADGRDTYIAAAFEEEEEANIYADGYREALEHAHADGDMFVLVQEIPSLR